MHKLLYNKKSGIALPLAMVTIMILLAVGTSLLTLGVNARLYSINDSHDITARCAADAGLTKAIYDMNAKLKNIPWDDGSLPSESNISLVGSNASYSYTVTNDGGHYVVTATGTCGNAQTTVSCILSLDGPFDAAIFCESYVWFHNNCTIDQYNTDSDTLPLKVGTNSTKHWQMCLFNDAIINGDAVVGAGGEPDYTIDNKGTITGQQYAMSSAQTLESVTVPPLIDSLPSQGTLEEGDVLVSGKYESIDLGNNKTVTIKGDVTLYVTGDIILGNSAQIIVDGDTPGSSLTIYLGGNLVSGNSSAVNNETQDPHNTSIYALDSCTKINMKNDSAFYGTIYAPEAEVVYNNSAALYGSVISKSFETKNAAPMHYDASLREPAVTDPLVKFKVTNWMEIN
ncbi:MAG: hypothetical protein JW787_08725 [Sedimentisphaerales bacterium]|nr:hypothetical protein [Sedimentisphaerales bacterium]